MVTITDEFVIFNAQYQNIIKSQDFLSQDRHDLVRDHLCEIHRNHTEIPTFVNFSTAVIDNNTADPSHLLYPDLALGADCLHFGNHNEFRFANYVPVDFLLALGAEVQPSTVPDPGDGQLDHS